MKIVLWVGNEPNQKALAQKIHAAFPLTGIVTETRNHKPVLTAKTLLAKAFEKIFLPAIGKAWWGMKSHYDTLYPDYPGVPLLDVENINSDAAFAFTKNLEADLILVSGTRLVKGKMLSIQPTIGILNLHTGLSPYIKGGPNCTNWCIATEQFHLIGNTVMWIDAGIDTGNILTTEFTEFTGHENLSEIHLRVMEHAHSLYLNSVGYIEAGKTKRIPQSDIAKGKTYYSKDWTLRRKIDLIRNIKTFKDYFKSSAVAKDRSAITVIRDN